MKLKHSTQTLYGKPISHYYWPGTVVNLIIVKVGRHVWTLTRRT